MRNRSGTACGTLTLDRESAMPEEELCRKKFRGCDLMIGVDKDEKKEE